jgi:hypothetical protein
VLVFAVVIGLLVLYSPAQGPFAEQDLKRIKFGMSVAEVEDVFGPAIPDAGSGLVQRSDKSRRFWKAWKGETYDIHVQFNGHEEAIAAVLQPRAPLRIHQVIQRLFR